MARAPQKNDRGRGGGGGEKKEYPSRKIITPPIRLSYPNIFDPRENDQGQDVWETEALVRPNKEGFDFLDKLEDTLTEVMEEYFGPEDEWPRGRNDYGPKDKIKKVDPDRLPGPGITEKWHKFTARSYSPVGVVDADRNDVLNKREAYGGRWARLSLTVTCYDNKSKGPAIYLNNVQLLENDESFGGRPAASDDFDKWEGEDPSEGRGSRREREGSGRSERDRPRDDDRRDSGRNREDSGSRGRGRDREDDEERDSRGGNRDASRGRDRDAERGRDRGDSERDGKARRVRSSDRDEEPEERPSRRGRDEEDRDSERSSGRGGRGARDEEREERGRGRSRDDDEERPSRRGRDRDEEQDDDWN